MCVYIYIYTHISYIHLSLYTCTDPSSGRSRGAHVEVPKSLNIHQIWRYTKKVARMMFYALAAPPDKVFQAMLLLLKMDCERTPWRVDLCGGLRA